MSYVNYGTPVYMRTRYFPGGGSITECLHELGLENHEQLKPGEQCQCGHLGLGIIRESEMNRTNDLTIFYESFESLVPRSEPTRWERFKLRLRARFTK